MLKDAAIKTIHLDEDSLECTHPLEPSTTMETPYQDNFEHLMALEMESRMHLMIAQQDALEKSSWLILENDPPMHNSPQSTQTTNLRPSTKQLIKKLRIMKESRFRKESQCRANGVVLHFDKLATLYELDAFERDVLMLLFFSATSHSFKSQIENSIFKANIEWDGIEVGAILSILETEFKNQIKRRCYFSIDARLIRNEIIVGRNQRYDRYGSILNENFCVHQRVANYIMGDNNVYSLDMTCIEKIQSRVDLDKLILPGKIKDDIVEQIANFIDNSERRSKLRLTEKLGYGTGMVCLFHGPSGTGKTMLAHGLANQFGMNLLLVNMEAGRTHNQSLDEIIKYAFREACLTNSIVFIDECDDIFKADTYESRTLLIEIEKADGITILATNKTLNLDPALDRRIQLKVPLMMPDVEERERIWMTLIPEGVELDSDVNIRELAVNYRFSGGLIKNVILNAINTAAHEKKNRSIVLTHSVLEKLAESQSAQICQYDHIGETYAPNRSIDNLLLNKHDKTRLKNIASCEKSGSLKKMGQGSLVVTHDLESAIKALEAVATQSGLSLRRYLLSDLLSIEAKELRMINPLNHEPMMPLDLPFQPPNGRRSMTVLIDDLGKLDGCFGKSDAQNEDAERLFNRIQGSRTHLYLVIKGNPGPQLPVGLLRVITIGFPRDLIQIQEWEKHIKGDVDRERYICQLVERQPMHPCQIRSVCREAALRSFIEHGSEELMCNFIDTVIQDRWKKQPVLFGIGDH